MNGGKTKYMLSTIWDTFNVVNDFFFMVPPLPAKMASVWESNIYKCFYGLSRPLSSTSLTRLNCCYTTSLYSLCFHMALDCKDRMQRPWETKVLGIIFLSIWISNDYYIRPNKELYDLFDDMNVFLHTNIQWLHWLRLFVWIEENVPARRVFDAGRKYQTDEII